MPSHPQFTLDSFMCIVRFYPILAAIFVVIAGMIAGSLVIAVINMLYNKMFRAGVWIGLTAACIYITLELAELFATCSATQPLVLTTLQ